MAMGFSEETGGKSVRQGDGLIGARRMAEEGIGRDCECREPARAMDVDVGSRTGQAWSGLWGPKGSDYVCQVWLCQTAGVLSNETINAYIGASDGG
jgi:hypothetical protein